MSHCTFRDKLYCALTCQLLGKSLDAVRQHMRGKKFQRAKGALQCLFGGFARQFCRCSIVMQLLAQCSHTTAALLLLMGLDTGVAVRRHDPVPAATAERYQNDELELMEEPSLREDATEVRNVKLSVHSV